jgi:hypothetical protein
MVDVDACQQVFAQSVYVAVERCVDDGMLSREEFVRGLGLGYRGRNGFGIGHRDYFSCADPAT